VVAKNYLAKHQKIPNPLPESLGRNIDVIEDPNTGLASERPPYDSINAQEEALFDVSVNMELSCDLYLMKVMYRKH